MQLAQSTGVVVQPLRAASMAAEKSSFRQWLSFIVSSYRWLEEKHKYFDCVTEIITWKNDESSGCSKVFDEMKSILASSQKTVWRAGAEGVKQETRDNQSLCWRKDGWRDGWNKRWMYWISRELHPLDVWPEGFHVQIAVALKTTLF